jgi:cupin domain
MRKKLMGLAGAAGVIALAGMHVENVRATDQFGFTGTTIAKGRFGDIDIANQVLREFGDATPVKDLWLSLQKTKGPSDLYVQSNEWAVGGSTGWHTHPGHSLIIVTAGTVTAYDASCAATPYTAGMGFVDPGGEHVHLLRNEGSVVARTLAVQLIPAAAARRIDVTPGPAGCPIS